MSDNTCFYSKDKTCKVFSVDNKFKICENNLYIIKGGAEYACRTFSQARNGFCS